MTDVDESAVARDPQRPDDDRPDELRAAAQTDAKNDRPNEPLGGIVPSADEVDQAEQPFEAPGEEYRSREQIEDLRLSEGPGPEPHRNR